MERLVKHILTNYYGETEVEGAGSNSVILNIIKWGISWAYDDSKTAYCAIGLSHAIHAITGNFKAILAARHFLRVGRKVENPVYGDIVVFWRGKPNGWKGHVGLYIRETKNYIYVLG